MNNAITPLRRPYQDRPCDTEVGAGMTRVSYRGYEIYTNWIDVGPAARFCFAHIDYDGAEDSHDQRSGFGRTVEDCKKQIDQIEEILAEERQQEISDNSQFGVGA